MGACCSSKNDQKSKEDAYNQLKDRIVIDYFTDFIVYKITASCGYNFLQKHIQLMSKDPNSNKEYEFLNVENNSKAIAFSQNLKQFSRSEADDKMLKVIFDFKEIIIHNNSNTIFDEKDVTHPICKLISNFRQKNVKPKTIYILYNNQILNTFSFFGNQEQSQNFICPVLIIDSGDIIFNTNIVSKENLQGSQLYIHSQKQYDINQKKYEELLNIQQFIFLYKNPNVGQASDNNHIYFENNINDKKKQQKTFNQISEKLANNYKKGVNTLLIHENNDRQSISQVLIAIRSMLLNLLKIEENNIKDYLEHRLPKGIFENFKQEVTNLQINSQIEQSSQKVQQKQKDQQEQIKNAEINFTELSNSVKIEILLEKLFIEQKQNIEEFEKSKYLIDKLIQNITNQFDKKEYRNLNKQNANLQCIFKYTNGQKILNTIGFIDSQENQGFFQNVIDDIAYFKSLKSDFTIACKNFSQSQVFLNEQKKQLKVNQNNS